MYQLAFFFGAVFVFHFAPVVGCILLALMALACLAMGNKPIEQPRTEQPPAADYRPDSERHWSERSWQTATENAQKRAQ